MSYQATKPFILRYWNHAIHRLNEADKRQHVRWSFCLTLPALCILPSLTALAAVTLIGFAKEVWDHHYGSGFCLWDMTANTLGIGLGYLGWMLAMQPCLSHALACG